MASTIGNVTFDCADAAAVARFWAEAVGYRLEGEANGERALLIDPAGAGPNLLFLRVPEGKAVKNRVHLDLTNEDVEAEAARLEGLGARRLRLVDRTAEIGERWWVMADPEGNEFCLG